MKNIHEQEFKELLKESPNAVLLDVRTKEECDQGILENAKTLSITDSENFISEIEKMDKSKSYFVYCLAGGRSATACQIMDQLGFKETYNLMGGISNWTGKIVKNDQ